MSAIEWLRKNGLIILSYNLNTPKLPLSNYADQSKFKTYLLDLGLLGAMLDLDSRLITSSSGILEETKGAYVENYVAAELTAYGCEKLYYWSSKSTAEVDFLISKNNLVFPIEVKSGYSRKGKSLRTCLK